MKRNIFSFPEEGDEDALWWGRYFVQTRRFDEGPVELLRLAQKQARPSFNEVYSTKDEADSAALHHFRPHANSGELYNKYVIFPCNYRGEIDEEKALEEIKKEEEDLFNSIYEDRLARGFAD